MEDASSTARRLARLDELEADFHRIVEAAKLEAMAEFAAGAGHEINNPLTVISGRAQLLLREESNPERRHALALISAQAMRVYEMIADMMLFARPPRPEVTRGNVVGLIDSLLASLAPAANRQETSLTYVGPREPVEIEADFTQLAVALRALCQNALEGLGSGGNIEIRLQEDASGALTTAGGNATVSDSPSVRISVGDDGPGMTPEQRRHIFDPFYSARQAGRGLGLGLSKAWRIVAQHGGRIEVASQLGQGAAFTMVLPAKIAKIPPSPAIASEP